jgi:hypothetical protein
MAGKVSQKSIGAMSRFLPVFFNGRSDVREILCENDFPDWFIRRTQQYAWNWLDVLLDLKRGTFFFIQGSFGDPRPIAEVTYDSHWDGDLVRLGEFYVQKMAAFICTQSGSDSVLRSLELEGLDVDMKNLTLVPIEGPVSAQEEEDRLTTLVKNSGLPQSQIVLKHIQDASSLYTEGKDQPSLGSV